jgi:glycerol kinase
VTASAAARYVLALDQGTTSSRAILFDHSGTVVASAGRELPQSFPSPGHVEQDPEAIWQTQIDAAREALARAAAGAADIAAIGITNQRETTVVWERETGRPVAPAIVWQSRVTADFCEQLRGQGLEDKIRARTGLPIDAYFSGPKVRHILRSRHGLLDRARAGELAFGTVDAFLLWRLTGGAVHRTDVSNASRTLLFDIHRLAWDEELLALMDVPQAMLPEVGSSSEIFGQTAADVFGAPIPIAGMAGDQQAATFGQACFRPGDAKTTYGTGAFLLLNTGDQPVESSHGLLATIAWQLGPEAPVTYALEGSVFVAGAAVQWLRDGLRAIVASADVEELAAAARGDEGLYLVPAFVGLGAPHWDERARGILIGLTRGTGLPEVARATIDSIAYQVRDVVEAMNADTGSVLRSMKADGGAAANDALLQFQADILDVSVERPVVLETTALGAAYLAGLSVGFWRDMDEIEANWALERRFEPTMDAGRRSRLYRGWQRAVERSRSWVEAD